MIPNTQLQLMLRTCTGTVSLYGSLTHFPGRLR